VGQGTRLSVADRWSAVNSFSAGTRQPARIALWRIAKRQMWYNLDLWESRVLG
jgi:hypothetical protein